MPDSHRGAELIAKIQELLQEQLESCSAVTFLGWTPESKAAHEKRSGLIRLLCLVLAAFEGGRLEP